MRRVTLRVMWERIYNILILPQKKRLKAKEGRNLFRFFAAGAFTPTDEAIVRTIEAYTFEGKARLVIGLQHYNAIKFSIGVCDFWRLDLELLAKLLNMATGSNIGNEELTKGSERIYNLGRIFNVMAGFRRKAAATTT